MKPKVLLVHGAWHNGAGFAALQAELAKHGFESQTVELSSVGTADQELGDMYQDSATVRASAMRLISGWHLLQPCPRL